MTESIRPASPGISPITTPGVLPSGPLSADKNAAIEAEKQSKVRYDLKASDINVDPERQHLKMAQQLADRTLKALQQGQQGLASVAEAWRTAHPPEGDQLTGPVGDILDAAGSSYRGIQPLMSNQSMQIGPHQVQGWEMVGGDGLIAMEALLPGGPAPELINQAWPKMSQALSIAQQQRDKLDSQMASMASEGSPEAAPQGIPAPDGRAHRRIGAERMIELLRPI
jgi:hypothetical protein